MKNKFFEKHANLSGLYQFKVTILGKSISTPSIVVNVCEGESEVLKPTKRYPEQQISLD